MKSRVMLRPSSWIVSPHHPPLYSVQQRLDSDALALAPMGEPCSLLVLCGPTSALSQPGQLSKVKEREGKLMRNRRLRSTETTAWTCKKRMELEPIYIYNNTSHLEHVQDCALSFVQFLWNKACFSTHHSSKLARLIDLMMCQAEMRLSSILCMYIYIYILYMTLCYNR